MAASNSIDCVLFDLDGSLIDTAPDFVSVCNRLLAEHDRPAMESARVHQTVSEGARALIKLCFEIEEGHEEFEPLRQQLLDFYEEQIAVSESALYPGLEELLASLDSDGTPWGIVTNKPERYACQLLDKLQLSERCGVLICPDHVEHSKPHPEPILLACDRLQRSTERTVYIGDHERDMQAAKSADVIAVAAAYGYVPAGDDPQGWYADFIVTDSRQIAGLLDMLKFS